MLSIKKYAKYLIIPFIPLIIVVLSYILEALFNIGVYFGTLIRLIAYL